MQSPISRFISKARLVCSLCALLLLAAAHAAPNTWLGKSTTWTDGANWSAGAAPAADRPEEVIIASVVDGASPVLTADAAVGGALRISAKASLDLNGHNLQVGNARTGARTDAKQLEGMLIESGATLLCEAGASTIQLFSGGLVNQGQVRGTPNVRLTGKVDGFVLSGGRQLTLAALSCEYSPYPYPVQAGGNLTVAGNLELAGGKLVIKPALNASPTTMLVKGDVIFRGHTPCAMLVTETNLSVQGTITSEGSAYCVEMPGEDRVWNKTDDTAVCRTRDNAGWVCLVGKGDQVITAGGILPALRLAKPSGKVRVTGDLHCNGLCITPENTLDLSKGQKLILGHFLRDWANNPEPNGVPAYAPCRTSRDLINQGALLGNPSVPVEFQLNIAGVQYVVACAYRMPEDAGEAEDTDALQYQAQPWTAPGSLAINRYDSRLALKDGKLLLDGKPCDPAAKPDDAGFVEKAAVDSASVKVVTASFQAPAATPRNIAPQVSRIATSKRASTAFAVNGPFWGNGDVYTTVDGDLRVGAGGAPYYEYVFPEPVTIGAARLFSTTGINYGCQFVLTADTAGNGVCDTVLAWTRDGVQADPKAWLSWGESWAAFTPVKVSRVRLQVYAADGTACPPAVQEFELYGDADSAARLAARPDAYKPESFPANARMLERGAAVNITWPAIPPEDRVCRIASIAFWMAGISWSLTTGESVHNKMPHLRAYKPCADLLTELKEKYHYDAVVIFFEGESVGVPWPTVNFTPALNVHYLQQRKMALLNRGDDDPLKETPDEEPGAGDVKYSETLKVADLPCQRNFLREFCEAAHEKGIAVYMITRPEDMGKLYIGPKDQDPYETFLKESVAAGVDGVSLVPDEAHPLWQGGGYAAWRQFDESTRDKRKDFTPVETRRWIEERSAVAGKCLTERKTNIAKVKPDCKFIVDGARLLNGGDPYDVIWHAVDPDYVGCSYQSQLVPRWAATSKNRRVAMGEYTQRSVRYNLESLLLGARMIRTYRFNYIELSHSEDFRRRENLFMEQFMRWGGTRPARPPIALLVSRASEAWWPEDCKAGRVKDADPDRCWMLEEILYEFLLKNGYTFDVYYLDQVDDLQALAKYKLVILPFAYSISRPAFARLTEAYKTGANFLVGERQGDVDEVGQPYPEPLLAAWMAQGKQAGRIDSPRVDLVELETLRKFVPAMTAMIDPLLGKYKELTLKRYGNRIEGVVHAISPREQYVSFINWEDKPVRFEAGLNLPDGQYTLLTLSSTNPELISPGSIAGQKTVSADTLHNFAITLQPDEALSLYIVPAERKTGQW